MRNPRTLRRSAVLAVLGLALTIDGFAAPPEHAERVRIQGLLDVVQEDDFSTGRTDRIHRVLDPVTGKRYRLRFERPPGQTLLSGSTVVVRGLAVGNELVVGTDDDSGVDVTAPAAAVVSGARTSLVLVVDYQDATVSCSDAAIADLMYTGTQSVDGLFQAASFGQLSFPGDTDGDGNPDVFRVSIDKPIGPTCDAYGWAADAEAAAPGVGADLSLYQHRIFVLPGSAPCSWAGLGNVGCGSYCRAWVKNCNLQDIYAHEEGHNLNMAHASTDTDNDGTIDCEYCDRSDIMGYAGVGWRLFNGAHEEQMGWMPGSQVVEVSQSGTSTHVLSPLQIDPALAPYPQVLKIHKQDSGDYYYLTYRQRQGYDATLNSAYADRTNVHRYAGAGYDNTTYVASLGDFESFSDEGNGLSVTQLSHDGSSATVQISTTCAAVGAGVTITPASQSAQPGTQLTYDVAVTNNDAALCGVGTFDLGASLPVGLTGSLDPASLSLDPGQQGSAVLTTTSDGGASDGGYVVTVHATDATEPAHAASADASYVVDGTAPDPVQDLTAAIKRKTRVQLTWTAPWDAASGIESYTIFRDGVWLDTSSDTSYVDTSTASGESYAYHVTARDAAGNESSAGNVAEIAVGGGGGGKKGGGGGTKEVCDDGLDNDGDGLTDCADTGCRRAKNCR